MKLYNKTKELDYRMCNILINPNLRSLDENTGAPLKKGRQLGWIILLAVILVIVVVNALVKIYAGM